MSQQAFEITGSFNGKRLVEAEGFTIRDDMTVDNVTDEEIVEMLNTVLQRISSSGIECHVKKRELE